jgi:hypothetical protein
MPYNTTFMSSCTSWVCMINGVQENLPHPYLLGYLIIFAVFVVFLALSMRMDFMQVVILDCFACTILSVLFYIAGIVDGIPIMACISLLLITSIFHFAT